MEINENKCSDFEGLFGSLLAPRPARCFSSVPIYRRAEFFLQLRR